MAKFHGGISRDKTLLFAAGSGQAPNMPKAARSDNNNK
jgi:ferredoxin-NADP reductase